MAKSIEEIKQKSIKKAVIEARKNLSSGGYVTRNDEVIAWMADKIELLEMPVNDALPLEDATDRIVKQLINEFEQSSLTIDTYTLAVGLGSMAKQLKAFGKHADTVELINKVLLKYEWEPSNVGCKLK